MKGCLQHIIKKLKGGCAIFGVGARWGDLQKVRHAGPVQERGCKLQKHEGTTKYITIESYTPYCPINEGLIHHRTMKECLQPLAIQNQTDLGECAQYFA